MVSKLRERRNSVEYTQTIVLRWEGNLRSERVHIGERTGMSFQISFHFIESSDFILHTHKYVQLKKVFLFQFQQQQVVNISLS